MRSKPHSSVPATSDDHGRLVADPPPFFEVSTAAPVVAAAPAPVAPGLTLPPEAGGAPAAAPWVVSRPPDWPGDALPPLALPMSPPVQAVRPHSTAGAR